MFENIFKFFKKAKKEDNKITDSKSAAKERLQLVLMQDRANVSADFLDLMRHEIIEVIKKYRKGRWNKWCTSVICKYSYFKYKK